MSERHSCGCSLCEIETELLAEFLESDRQESCRKLFASEPELAAFAGPGPLLAHLRLCRFALGGGPPITDRGGLFHCPVKALCAGCAIGLFSHRLLKLKR